MRLAAAFALNAALWFYTISHPGITGKVNVDAPKFFIHGCLAALAVLPSIGVFRFGTLWQKALAAVLLILPARSLFLMGQWATEHS